MRKKERKTSEIHPVASAPTVRIHFHFSRESFVFILRAVAQMRQAYARMRCARRLQQCVNVKPHQIRRAESILSESTADSRNQFLLARAIILSDKWLFALKQHWHTYLCRASATMEELRRPTDRLSRSCFQCRLSSYECFLDSRLRDLTIGLSCRDQKHSSASRPPPNCHPG